MFSSNSLPNLSSSNYHHFPPFISSSHESDNINTTLFFNPHHHHHDPIPGVFLPSNPRIINDSSFINIAVPENLSATMTSKQDIHTLNGGYFCHSNLLPVERPAAKKDRHSKICTAQGLRDRRVRLSIEIAREFFDLQDMLGFDKASKTLGWLLKKSKKAIKELAQRKNSSNDGAGGHNYSRCLSSVSECDDDEGGSSGSKVASEKLQKTALQIMAKESRDKARARARQRTRERMCTRISLNDQISRPQMLFMTTELRSDNNNNININNNNNNSNNKNQTNMEYSPLKVVEVTSSQPLADHHHHHEAPTEDVIERSVVLKRKLNIPSSINYQPQNLGLMFKDETRSNINNNYNPSLPQNWDINSAVSHSTVRAITNMNLSTGFQIYGKTWEGRN